MQKRDGGETLCPSRPLSSFINLFFTLPFLSCCYMTDFQLNDTIQETYIIGTTQWYTHTDTHTYIYIWIVAPACCKHDPTWQRHGRRLQVSCKWQANERSNPQNVCKYHVSEKSKLKKLQVPGKWKIETPTCLQILYKWRVQTPNERSKLQNVENSR